LGPVDFKFNPTSNQFATSSVDGSLRVFNLRESEEQAVHYSASLAAENHMANAWKLGYSPDGSEILTG